MYAQTSLVTSVRGADFLPQTAASASLSFFVAALLMFVLAMRFFSAVIFL